MKEVALRVGTSLLAAVIGYVVLTLLAEGLSNLWKLAIAIALGVLAFAASVWAATKSDTPLGREAETSVASNLRGKNARIQGVTANAEDAQKLEVASNIQASEDIEIKDVNATSFKKKQ